ncbi:MAG: LamG domain-containing protein [Planctomycetota bacterium]
MRRFRTATVLALALALAAASAQAGVVAYYSFDDETATDLSPNGNHGVEGSGVVYSPDTPFGTGLSFETPAQGSAHVITVPTSDSLEAIDDQFTLSFWMRARLADQGNWVRIFQHGTEANGDQTWLVDRFSSTDRTNMRVDTVDDPGPPFVDGQFNQNIATGGPTTFDDQWHHLAYVIDNGSFKKFVDGAVTSGSYKHGAGLANTRPLYMGGRNGTAQYVGLLDEVALYDQPLDDDLVRMLANGAPPLNIPEPATVSLLALGGLALVRRRRRH